MVAEAKADMGGFNEVIGSPTWTGRLADSALSGGILQIDTIKYEIDAINQ